MINVIGSLNIALPGGVMYSKQECFKQLENGDVEPIYEKFDHSTMVVNDTHFDKKLKKQVTVNKTLHIHTAKCRPAVQSIPITEDAYKGFIEDCPGCVQLSVWKRMNSKERLLWNLNAIANDMGGKLIDYYINRD